MTEKPIPCPVCGGKPEVIRYGIWFMAYCTDFACDYSYFCYASTEDEAIRMWNKVAIDSKVQEEPNE